MREGAGAETRREMAGVAAATEAEVRSLAKRLHGRMRELLQVRSPPISPSDRAIPQSVSGQRRGASAADLPYLA